MRNEGIYDSKFADKMEFANKALNQGPYKDALRHMLALPISQIRQTIPKASYSDFNKLLFVLEHASAANIARSTLKENIVALGCVPLSIAKMVPGLTGVLE